MTERVAIVAGARTPFVKAGTAFRNKTFLDLSIPVVQEAISRSSISPQDVEELAFGSVLLDPRLPNAAREIVLRSSLPNTIPAHFISNNCITGLVAINAIAEAISRGRIKIGVAGGCEAMSTPSFSVHPHLERALLRANAERGFMGKFRALSTLRPRHFFPKPPSPKEPSTGLTMGQHCELMVQDFGITREPQDAYALLSHQKAARAEQEGHLSRERISLDSNAKDNLVRGDTTLEKLAKLQPVFERSAKGTLTAGNSSALTDGASAVVLMAESEAKKREIPTLAYIHATAFTAIEPKDGLLMAPATAVPQALLQAGFSFSQIDRFEVHEAFAGQVLCNMQAWEKGWQKYSTAKAVGVIPSEKLNVRGGSLALGHPFAATGGRLVMSLADQLNTENLSSGLISVCAAGAMAGAMVLTR